MTTKAIIGALFVASLALITFLGFESEEISVDDEGVGVEMLWVEDPPELIAGDTQMEEVTSGDGLFELSDEEKINVVSVGLFTLAFTLITLNIFYIRHIRRGPRVEVSS